jgi:F1F0 ATPase subunit 2
MILNEWDGLIFAFVFGIVFGIVYFGGLWLTVKNIQRVRNPGLVTVTSMVGRLALLMSGIFIVSRGNSAKVVFCLLGLMVTRTVWISRLMPRASNSNSGGSDYGIKH